MKNFYGSRVQLKFVQSNTCEKQGTFFRKRKGFCLKACLPACLLPCRPEKLAEIAFFIEVHVWRAPSPFAFSSRIRAFFFNFVFCFLGLQTSSFRNFHAIAAATEKAAVTPLLLDAVPHFEA